MAGFMVGNFAKEKTNFWLGIKKEEINGVDKAPGRGRSSRSKGKTLTGSDAAGA